MEIEGHAGTTYRICGKTFQRLVMFDMNSELDIYMFSSCGRCWNIVNAWTWARYGLSGSAIGWRGHNIEFLFSLRDLYYAWRVYVHDDAFCHRNHLVLYRRYIHASLYIATICMEALVDSASLAFFRFVTWRTWYIYHDIYYVLGGLPLEETMCNIHIPNLI